MSYVWHQNSSNISWSYREGNPIAYDCSIEKNDLEGIGKLSGDIVYQRYNILSIKEGTHWCVFFIYGIKENTIEDNNKSS